MHMAGRIFPAVLSSQSIRRNPAASQAINPRRSTLNPRHSTFDTGHGGADLAQELGIVLGLLEFVQHTLDSLLGIQSRKDTPQLPYDQIGRAHVCTPVTWPPRMPSSA